MILLYSTKKAVTQGSLYRRPFFRRRRYFHAHALAEPNARCHGVVVVVVAVVRFISTELEGKKAQGSRLDPPERP